MCQFVGNHLRHPLFIGFGGLDRVVQQRSFPISARVKIFVIFSTLNAYFKQVFISLYTLSFPSFPIYMRPRTHEATMQ